MSNHAACGPALTAAELAGLDCRLRQLDTKFSLVPLPPHNLLVHEARKLLEAYRALRGGDGRWESCQCVGRIHLPWSRFGSNHLPVWNALHSAFVAMLEYVFRTPTTRQAGEVAGRIHEYLELRGCDLPQAQSSQVAEMLEVATGKTRALLRYTYRRERAQLEDIALEVWRKPIEEVTRDAIASAVKRANEHLQKHGSPWIIVVEDGQLLRKV